MDEFPAGKNVEVVLARVDVLEEMADGTTEATRVTAALDAACVWDCDIEVRVTVRVCETTEVEVPLVTPWAATRPELAARTERTRLENCILTFALTLSVGG